ncbi:MAG TPA: hypothetical protein VJ372_08350 [Pyrinomonadaceae bacterium]|nr:hypothetical protein [Pyrinomonadaceae bacterium]
MGDWIGLGIIVFIVVCGLVGLSHLGKPYDVTIEEYERRAHEAPGLISAGLVGLQKALDPATEKAVVAQEDLRQGRFDGEQESGAPPEAGEPDDGEQQTT